MQKHLSRWNELTRHSSLQNRTQISPSGLDRIPHLGLGAYLSIPEAHNPQPNLINEEAAYLFGPAGQDGAMQMRGDGRGVIQEPIYGFWGDQGRGVVVSVTGPTQKSPLTYSIRICGIGRMSLEVDILEAKLRKLVTILSILGNQCGCLEILGIVSIASPPVYDTY